MCTVSDAEFGSCVERMEVLTALYNICIYLHAAVADAVRTSLGPRGMDKMVKIVILCLPYLLLWLYVTLVAGFYGVAIH